MTIGSRTILFIDAGAAQCVRKGSLHCGRESSRPPLASPSLVMQATQWGTSLSAWRQLRPRWVENMAELTARVDSQLGEDFSEVILGRARADEKSCADFNVGQPVACEQRNVQLLTSERAGGGLHRALTCFFASCQQLPTRTISKSGYSDRAEDLVGGAEVKPGVDPAPGSSQPFSVQQMGASRLDAQPCARQMVDAPPMPVNGIFAHQGV